MSPPILIKFGIKHHSVLVHLPTKFQVDKSKLAWVRQFEKILKKFKIWKNLNALIGFGQIRYQSSLMNVIYLCVVLGR